MNSRRVSVTGDIVRFFVMFVAGALATGFGYQSSPPNRPWPPGVQRVSPESPALSPEESLNTFYMPPGYRLELVAAEPLIQDPVALDWDVDGRLWAVEMPGWMPDIAATGERAPVGRVVVLEDENGDGRMDKRTVFADGLVLARSLKILDRGVLVGEPPNVWLMHDTDGDLRMDRKELVSDQYGHRDIDPENNANGFNWSIDNRMYTAGQSDIQLRLKEGAFEVQRTLRRGEWGVTHDDAGRIYRNTNESALHVDFVQTAYYARNPNLLRTRGSYERLATGNEDLNIVWPVRPNPGTNRAYQAGIDRPDGTLLKFTAVCAPVVYRGDRLPADLYGNVFVAEPAANLVSRLVLDDDGSTLWARKAYERGEFLASTDERFRPVYIVNAPDGTLYIADMYRGIIEHRISITEYLRDQILGRKLEQPIGMGRIYRVVHETMKRDTSTRVAASPPARLVDLLSHPNGWWRDTAQRLLVERASVARAGVERPGVARPGVARNFSSAITSALIKHATSAKDARTRLHALWTLDGIDTIPPAVVIHALEDPARDVRASAIRIAERWLAEAGHPIREAVLKRLDDRDWWVRQQLAASIGALPVGAREAPAAAMLERYAMDPVVMDATLSGLRGSEGIVLDTLLRAGEQTTQRDTAITMLAATLVRSSQDAAIQHVLASIADGRLAAWQRSALLRGAEVTLLGAAMPAPAVRPRGAPMPTAPAEPLPCPTCPGGRAGPGGAYAFTRPAEPARGRGRGGSSGLRLNREPAALTALAADGGDLAVRATGVLARIAWPGKPGAATVTPLTAEEQQRYDAGHDVYRNLCQACHQPDGRGQDRLAPTLIDSEWALAPSEIPVRILLHGKEGSFGLMPPIGAALTDDQIAAVLTYIRREWGQTGAPVAPAAVTDVRARTAGRTRPWTEDELRALRR
jgi:mono/diheme cytochrome c family protein/glucose/arabinose dehydrogenase